MQWSRELPSIDLRNSNWCVAANVSCNWVIICLWVNECNVTVCLLWYATQTFICMHVFVIRPTNTNACCLMLLHVFAEVLVLTSVRAARIKAKPKKSHKNAIHCAIFELSQTLQSELFWFLVVFSRLAHMRERERERVCVCVCVCLACYIRDKKWPASGTLWLSLWLSMSLCGCIIYIYIYIYLSTIYYANFCFFCQTFYLFTLISKPYCEARGLHWLVPNFG